MEVFELRGPNRNPGVIFEQAWVDTRSHIVFVIAESGDEEATLEELQEVLGPKTGSSVFEYFQSGEKLTAEGAEGAEGAEDEK